MVRKDSKLAQEARTAFEKWRQHFKYNIDQYHRIMNFVFGRQWTDDEEDTLKTFKKVPLQVNQLATLVNTLLGEQQQNTPQLDIYPLSNCDEETASIRQTIVKDLMLSTDAKTVYQQAAMQAFGGGFGAFMLDTDYESETDFDTSPKYISFKDPTRCYWSQDAEHVNKIDGIHCGYVFRKSRQACVAKLGKDVTDEIFGENFPYAPPEEVALAVQPGLTEDPFSWADADGVTFNRYIKRVYKTDTIYKLSNGEVVDQKAMDKLVEESKKLREQLREQDELLQELSGFQSEEMPGMMPEQQMQQGAQQPIPGMQLESPASQENLELEDEEENDERVTLYYEGFPVRIEAQRKIKRSKIMQYEIAGDFIVDESEMPCDDLPLIFMDQNSYYEKDGKQICRPFIIDAVDSQRYINYLVTQSAFILKISRYDQFMGSVKNVASNDTQRNWRDPYTVKGIITYDESPNGNKPEQIRPPELSQSLTTQLQVAMDNIHTCTGLYPTKLGQQGNEISGAAIDARTRQGSYPVFVAFNSVNRAIEAGGKILNQMIPRVYDTERVITLRNTDTGRKTLTINKEVDEYGEKVENDLRKGTFVVELKAGPSYEGQKEVALNSLQMLIQADPSLLKMFADLYAENLPLSNTLEIKNRLKTMVPPEIVEAGKTGKMPKESGQQQPTPEEQAAQATMQFQQAQIQIKQQELELKAKQMQADIEIEKMKLEIAQMELAGNIEEQRMRYMAETERTQSDNAIAHADNLVKIMTHKVQ